MDSDYDIAIVGAGLAGAATAHYVRKLTLERGRIPPRVVVLEKEPTAGQHSSGRNAAMVRRHLEDPVLAPLAEAGGAELATGELAPFQPYGSVLIGLGNEPAASHFPPAQGHGLWCPTDGVIDTAALLGHYLQGQELRCQTQVLGWKPAVPTPEAPLRIRTDSGEIIARVLVNAGGPWAGMLGDLPLTPSSRHLLFTPPMRSIQPDWPFVWDVERGLYFRPESGGLLLCACDETPADPGVYAENPGIVDRLAHLLEVHQPRLGEIKIMRTWVGQRTFSPDRRFVIGFDYRDPRLFHVAGLGGHGVTTSPAVGRMAAEMLLDAQAHPATPFSPVRFDNR